MNQPRSGCLPATLIVCLILLGLSIVMNLVLAMGNSSSVTAATGHQPKFEENILTPASGKGNSDKIVVIYLRGVISGMEPGAFGDTAVDDIKVQLKQAEEDKDVKAVVIHVDSPGGEVTASDTIYNAVKRFRDKKPVVIYMGSMAASGGYYVACAGNHIIANDTTFTGSIGVIMQSIKYKALSEKVGVEFVTFKSGKMKDMLSGSRDLSDEEKEYVQNMIMQTYDKFVGIVAKERKLPEAELRSGIADGRIVTGKDAEKAKLIDQIGEVEDAYAKAIALGKANNARIVRYESPIGFGRFLRLLGDTKARPAKVEVALPGGLVPHIEAGKAYYLPSFLAQ